MKKDRENAILNDVVNGIKQYQTNVDIDNLIKAEAGVIKVLNELIKGTYRQPDEPRRINVYGSDGKVADTYTVDNNGEYKREIVNATD